MNIKEQIKHVRALVQALDDMENCKLLRDIDPAYYDSACAGFEQEYRDKVQILVNSLAVPVSTPDAYDKLYEPATNPIGWNAPYISKSVTCNHGISLGKGEPLCGVCGIELPF